MEELGGDSGLHLRAHSVCSPSVHSQEMHKAQAAGIRQRLGAHALALQKLSEP